MQVEPEVARYRDFIAACPLPVLIGETGRDGIGRNIGWQQQGVSELDFFLEMWWLAENIGAWGYTAFAYGCTEDWRDKGFETKDNAEFRDLIRTFDYSGFKRPERRETPVSYNEFHVEHLVSNKTAWSTARHPGTIVIHSTRGGAATAEAELQATINWFQSAASGVSAHLVIAANGDWWYCVPWNDAAWHAKTYNPTSIGIELVQQTPTTPFTEHQYIRLIEALNWLRSTYGIPKVRGIPGIVGHEAIDPAKSDPGAMFDWTRLGLAAVPVPPADMTAAEKLAEVRADIAALARKWSV